ncbi:MAG: hypothetical protein KGZ39_05770 [Simkania sp.]|nr:hypothetical protein [Simkania sp.]
MAGKTHYNMPYHRVLEHNGKKLTISEWSKELGIKKGTLITRLGKYDAGQYTSMDQVLYTGKISSSCLAVGALPEDHVARADADIPTAIFNYDKKMGPIRIAAVRTLFEAFARHGMPKVDEEMREYIHSGRLGNAMKFFLQFEKFFPSGTLVELDEQQNQTVASVAFVVGNKQPQPLTIEAK